MPKRHSLDFVKNKFKECGYTPLFKEYKNSTEPLSFICDKGHHHKISFNNFKKGQRCGVCFGNRSKYSLEKVKELFISKGYTPLFDKYFNNRQMLDYICSEGHKQKISVKMLNKGFGCTFCSGHRKYSFEEVRKQFISEGYTPLFKEYNNTNERLVFICPEGHKNGIKYSSWLNGHRCSICSGNKRFSVEQIKEEFIKEGYIPLFSSYENNSQLLAFKCPKGHKNNISFMSFRAGRKCSLCAIDDRRFSIEYVKKCFLDIGYVPLFTEYARNQQRLPFICDKGHKSDITITSLKQGHRCSVCQHLGVSKAEEEISHYLEGLGFNIERNTRKIIPPYELDIFIPEKNLAIEYCGLYWHSEISGGKDRRYHYQKRKMCEDIGIRLITIFEDEYRNNLETVLSRIDHALGAVKNRIYARACEARSIPLREAYCFLKDNHFQNSGVAKIAFGLFYKHQLVAVMTGGAVSRAHTAKEKTLEMKRLCFLPGYSVVGGSSKLFKLLLRYSKEKNYTHIKSYQDMRYGNPFNPVYEKLGFSLVGESKYTPHYVDKLHVERYRNQSLRKTPEERKTGKTEWELRREQGYDRIWDCGHRTYELKL